MIITPSIYWLSDLLTSCVNFVSSSGIWVGTADNESVKRWFNVGQTSATLGRRLRRLPNVKLAFCQRLAMILLRGIRVAPAIGWNVIKMQLYRAKTWLLSYSLYHLLNSVVTPTLSNTGYHGFRQPRPIYFMRKNVVNHLTANEKKVAEI